MNPSLDRHIDPTAFFSPSKARQQRAQAAEWSHIDSWLSTRYPKPPSFERNEDTLAALLALVAVNERADEEALMVADLEAEALQQLVAREEREETASVAANTAAILRNLEDSLDASGSQSLDTLAQLSATLPTPSTLSPPTALATALIQLQSTAADLEQAHARLAHTHAHLTAELSRQQSLLSSVSPTTTISPFAPPPSLPERTSKHQRDTKILRSKIREYEDRLAGLPARGAGGAGAIAVRLSEREEDVEGLRKRVEELESRVAEFEGLPGDREGARAEVRRVEGELKRLKERRDRLFRGDR